MRPISYNMIHVQFIMQLKYRFWDIMHACSISSYASSVKSLVRQLNNNHMLMILYIIICQHSNVMARSWLGDVFRW